MLAKGAWIAAFLFLSSALRHNEFQEGVVTPYIVGGEEVDPAYKYQWMVALFSLGSGRHFCGASYITDRWILTAAHCLAREPSEVQVHFHRHNVARDADDERAIIIDVEQIFRHPNYSFSTFNNDIALIKMKKVGPSGYQSIPYDNDGSFTVSGANATVLGWGVWEEGSPRPPTAHLREVTIPVILTEDCRQYYSPGVIFESMICAGVPEGGKDACQGDSGGPLVVQPKPGVYVQIGIVSAGEGCARPAKPGVYSKIYHNADWVKQIITDNS